MKILLVNQHPQDTVGGSEIQCDLIARHLAQSGHTVVYFAVQGKQQSYQTPYTVEPGTFDRGGFQRILVKHRPDLVYWRLNRRHFLPSVLLCKRMGIKFVFAVSSWGDLHKWAYRLKTDQLPFSKKLPILYQHSRQSLITCIHYLGYYFVDGVIVQLEQQRHTLPVAREIVIHNSVDATATPFRWEKPFVIWIGTFKPIKNPELYIGLARHFQQTGIDFLMVGVVRGRYTDILEHLSLPSNLHLLGLRPHQEVNGILQQALFLVQTSDTEGFPNVFIQAWAQGIPTIGLYYDPDRMVQKNNLGFISGSFEQLIKDTKTLLDNTSLRKQMGQRAQQFAAEHFNPARNVKKFEAFFREICDKRETYHYD